MAFMDIAANFRAPSLYSSLSLSHPLLLLLLLLFLLLFLLLLILLLLFLCVIYILRLFFIVFFKHPISSSSVLPWILCRPSLLTPWSRWFVICLGILSSVIRCTSLARPSNNWKLQTRPLVREGAQNQQTHNCLKMIKGKRQIGRWCQIGAWHQDRLAVFDFDLAATEWLIQLK
jgi:hypothetical protein